MLPSQSAAVTSIFVICPNGIIDPVPGEFILTLGTPDGDETHILVEKLLLFSISSSILFTSSTLNSTL